MSHRTQFIERMVITGIVGYGLAILAYSLYLAFSMPPSSATIVF